VTRRKPPAINITRQRRFEKKEKAMSVEDFVGPRPTDAERSAATTLLGMIWGTHISRAVFVAAELGIADLLADGPLSSSELARRTGTHAPALYRVLRLLAALGVLDHDDAGVFSLTIVGERLRTDAPAGLRSWATFLDAVGAIRGFEHILETVRTGRPGFDLAHATTLFEFLDGHPDRAATFDTAMSERTAAFAASVADGYDFSDIRTVVDVGGGQGILLAEILRRHHHLEGVLFDLPATVARPSAVLGGGGHLADRCHVIAGDFFARVPEGADCYVLANVLHDWDDTAATLILHNCRCAMAKHAKVLIVERRIPEAGGDANPGSAERHQHARDHRRTRTHRRRIRRVAERGGAEVGRHHAGGLPVLRDRGHPGLSRDGPRPHRSLVKTQTRR
jgi:O-methyltransferase domain/Dimerisation domain